MTYVFNIKECEKIDPLYVTQKAKESPTDRKGSGYSPVLTVRYIWSIQIFARLFSEAEPCSF